MNYELDVWGDMCPIPLIKAQKKIKEMKSGDRLILETEHSCTSRTIVQWAKQKNYPVRETEVANGIWRLELTKA